MKIKQARRTEKIYTQAQWRTDKDNGLFVLAEGNRGDFFQFRALLCKNHSDMMKGTEN